MTVYRYLFIAAALLLSGTFFTPETALAKTVSDPNHVGYTGKHPKLKQVEFKPIKVKCKQCTGLAEQYNQTVQQLLDSRYWVEFWRQVELTRKAGKEQPFWGGKKGDITNFEALAAAANLELFELQQQQLELHKRLVRMLQEQAAYLQWAIEQCEASACPGSKGTKFKAIEIGGQPVKQNFEPELRPLLASHGIPWQGPYRTNCAPCMDQVRQLNALPGWVVRADMRLQRLSVELAYAESIEKSNAVGLGGIKYEHPDQSIDKTALKAQIQKVKAELAGYKKLFEQLIKSLRECERKFCPAREEPKVSMGGPGTPDRTTIAVGPPMQICPEPAANEPINIGANDDIGSSADFQEKVKNKAVGAAASAVGSLLGLGGGGGGGDSGPPTYKDPIRNGDKIRVRDKAIDRDLRIGAAWTGDGLLISSEIEDAPGKGTFHQIFLQNEAGWRLFPIRVWLYEIWGKWTLNVSWTRDTYVDGELVKHESGGWTESWSELIARGEFTEYAEASEAPLWQQLGFTTAVSGASAVGTLFPVDPALLAQGPMDVLVHVSVPDADPVMTYPYLFSLGIDDKGDPVLTPSDQPGARSNTACETGVSAPPGELQIINDPYVSDLAEAGVPHPDRDGDGLADAVDSDPDNVSTEFNVAEGSLPGRIVNAGGNEVVVTPSGDGSAIIEVRGGSDGNPAVIEVLGVELELAPGTMIEASFG